MNMSLRQHALLVTMLGAALACGMTAPVSASQPSAAQQAQQHENRSDARHKADKGKAEKSKKEKADKPSVRNQAAQPVKSRNTAQRNASDQQNKRPVVQRQDNNRQRISERDQRTRIDQQRAWMQANVQYQQQARKLERQRAQQMQQANRNAQYRYQQTYYQRLNAQQIRLNNQRYDYNSNPFFSLPNTYRYSYAGRTYATNQYGADLLRQAVNYGYQEGLRAGYADRSDRSNSDYRNSYAYQDASYGYDNYYVDRQEYIHYFREGFKRGYNDGYGSRRQYGRYSSNYLGGYDNNGTATILQAVLGTILNLQQMNP